MFFKNMATLHRLQSQTDQFTNRHVKKKQVSLAVGLQVFPP